jgi:hypothetical protein
LPTNKRQSGGG